MLVWMKALASSMERSTWLSAAKFTTASGRCSAKTRRTSTRSAMSPWTKVRRGSPRTSARFSRLPA
jgi:hypothetical protein